MAISVRRLQRAGSSGDLSVGNIYLSPVSPSVVSGANTTLNLRINPGTAVTAVQATINFDPTKLAYVSISYSGSPFTSTIEETISTNTITVARAIMNPAGVNTDSLVASIVFNALTATGTSPLTLSDANAVYNSNYTNPTTTNATVTFTS